MAEYVLGSGISYLRYLQTQRFVDDIRWSIRRNTFQQIATQDELKRAGVRISSEIDQSRKQLEAAVREGTSATVGAVRSLQSSVEQGFDDVVCGLSEISGELNSIENTINFWSHEIVSSLGRLNDNMDDLRRLARTPEQVWSYEQFDIARDAVRRGLHQEAIDHLHRAIDGYGGHPGYRLEPRFRFLLGKILLGSPTNHAAATVNPTQAEAAFLMAARYFRHDLPREAATSLVYAGRAAYAAARPVDGRLHAIAALQLHSDIAGAHFLLAKVLLHEGTRAEGVTALKAAIMCDRLYSIRWEADDDFVSQRANILQMIGELRDENAAAASAEVKRLLPLHEELAATVKNVPSLPGQNTSPPAVQDITPLRASVQAALQRGATFFAALETRDRVARFGREMGEQARVVEKWAERMRDDASPSLHLLPDHEVRSKAKSAGVESAGKVHQVIAGVAVAIFGIFIVGLALETFGQQQHFLLNLLHFVFLGGIGGGVLGVVLFISASAVALVMGAVSGRLAKNREFDKLDTENAKLIHNLNVARGEFAEISKRAGLISKRIG